MDGGSLSDTQRTMVLPLLQETNIRGRPYVTVSSKGIKNNLSRYPNDGADFGPDTTLGATALGQNGSPYTETTGIMEAHAYAQIHNGAVVKFTAGNSANGSPYYIDIPLTIGQTDGEIVIWEFEGYVFIQPSNSFTAGQPMIIVGNSNLPSPDIHIYGQRVQINGYTPSGTYVASSAFSFQGLGNGQPAYYFTFEKCQMNGFQSGGSLIENTGVENRSIIMRGMVYQGGGYNFFDNTSVGGFYFIDSTTGPIVSTVPSGGAMGITFLRGSRPTSLNLSSTGGEHIIIFEDSGVGGAGNLITATGYSAEAPCNIFFVGDCTLLQEQANANYFQIGNYVNIFAENIRFALNTTSGTSFIINPTSSGALNGNIYLGKVRLRSYSAGGILDIGNTSYLITPNQMIDAWIIEQATGTVQNVYPPPTPTVPASGTALQNTNPYKVKAYLYGGTVTEIQITRNGIANTVLSNSSGLALSGQLFELLPLDEITLTYTTAPTWVWLS
jgi:hypothetical protein